MPPRRIVPTAVVDATPASPPPGSALFSEGTSSGGVAFKLRAPGAAGDGAVLRAIAKKAMMSSSSSASALGAAEHVYVVLGGDGAEKDAPKGAVVATGEHGNKVDWKKVRKREREGAKQREEGRKKAIDRHSDDKSKLNISSPFQPTTTTNRSSLPAGSTRRRRSASKRPEEERRAKRTSTALTCPRGSRQRRRQGSAAAAATALPAPRAAAAPTSFPL